MVNGTSASVRHDKGVRSTQEWTSRGSAGGGSETCVNGTATTAQIDFRLSALPEPGSIPLAEAEAADRAGGSELVDPPRNDEFDVGERQRCQLSRDLIGKPRLAVNHDPADGGGEFLNLGRKASWVVVPGGHR